MLRQPSNWHMAPEDGSVGFQRSDYSNVEMEGDIDDGDFEDEEDHLDL